MHLRSNNLTLTVNFAMLIYISLRVYAHSSISIKVESIDIPSTEILVVSTTNKSVSEGFGCYNFFFDPVIFLKIVEKRMKMTYNIILYATSALDFSVHCGKRFVSLKVSQQ